jgi:hypothetical protein
MLALCGFAQPLKAEALKNSATLALKSQYLGEVGAIIDENNVLQINLKQASKVACTDISGSIYLLKKATQNVRSSLNPVSAIDQKLVSGLGMHLSLYSTYKTPNFWIFPATS